MKDKKYTTGTLKTYACMTGNNEPEHAITQPHTTVIGIQCQPISQLFTHFNWRKKTQLIQNSLIDEHRPLSIRQKNCYYLRCFSQAFIRLDKGCRQSLFKVKRQVHSVNRKQRQIYAVTVLATRYHQQYKIIGCSALRTHQCYWVSYGQVVGHHHSVIQWILNSINTGVYIEPLTNRLDFRWRCDIVRPKLTSMSTKLPAYQIPNSVYNKTPAIDAVFIKSDRRSVKYIDLYLQSDVKSANAELTRYLNDNNARIQQSIGGIQ